jgi:hypothetical protein
MAVYKISATVKTEMKQPRLGEREALRYRLLRLLDHPDVSQRTRRSLVVKRVV